MADPTETVNPGVFTRAREVFGRAPGYTAESVRETFTGEGATKTGNALRVGGTAVGAVLVGDGARRVWVNLGRDENGERNVSGALIGGVEMVAGGTLATGSLMGWENLARGVKAAASHIKG